MTLEVTKVGAMEPIPDAHVGHCYLNARGDQEVKVVRLLESGRLLELRSGPDRLRARLDRESAETLACNLLPMTAPDSTQWAALRSGIRVTQVRDLLHEAAALLQVENKDLRSVPAFTQARVETTRLREIVEVGTAYSALRSATREEVYQLALAELNRREVAS